GGVPSAEPRAAQADRGSATGAPAAAAGGPAREHRADGCGQGAGAGRGLRRELRRASAAAGAAAAGAGPAGAEDPGRRGAARRPRGGGRRPAAAPGSVQGVETRGRAGSEVKDAFKRITPRIEVDGAGLEEIRDSPLLCGVSLLESRGCGAPQGADSTSLKLAATRF